MSLSLIKSPKPLKNKKGLLQKSRDFWGFSRTFGDFQGLFGDFQGFLGFFGLFWAF
jgi:hypothetical protein